MSTRWKPISEVTEEDKRSYLIGQDRYGNVREIKWWKNGGYSGWEYHGGNAFNPLYFRHMPKEHIP